MPKDGGWEYGTNLDYMKEISEYWVNMNLIGKNMRIEINTGFQILKLNVDGIEVCISSNGER